MLTVPGHLTDLGRTLKSLLCFQLLGNICICNQIIYIYTVCKKQKQISIFVGHQEATPFPLTPEVGPDPGVEHSVPNLAKFPPLLGQIANFLPFAKINNILMVKYFLE